jgi:siderophore synthetase component
METSDPGPSLGATLAPARPAPRGGDGFVFEKLVHPLGRFRLRALRNPEDMAVVHAWVTQEHARYWGLLGRSLEEVVSAYQDIARRANVYLGFFGEAPAFLLETYWPGQDPVGQHFDVKVSDRGMHVLVAPAQKPLAGFTWAVFGTVMDFLFGDPTVERIVVEPDVRNGKIHALNRRAGFGYQRILELPHKRAHLAFCTRAQYTRAVAADGQVAKPVSAASLCAHLEPEVWQEVNAALVRKAIAEFAHELLVEPRLERREGTWGHYCLDAGQPGTSYRFRARQLALEHWDIDAASLVKWAEGLPVPVDALDLIIDLREQLAIAPDMLPVYLEEILSTLYGASYKHVEQRARSADLVHAGYQEIEAAMTEGHPSFVANNGRVGFDARDYQAYAPEARAPIRLVWLAAHRRNAEWNAIRGLSCDTLMAEELGADLPQFQRLLSAHGLQPSDYLFLPVHPWQWFNKLAMVFAPDIASRDLVCLGQGTDEYQAQQSIRTLFNTSAPERRLVKTALSVLNMGFMRGLSPDYMQGTPAINDHLADLVDGDPYFAGKGFRLLREVAAIGYHNRLFESALPKASPYRKMLAALWRESPVPHIRPGQRLMTMAALLHRDREGAALAPQLIKASGLDTDTWLARYLDCYLAPLLHCFYAHDLAFMPHGENLILVLQEQVVVGAFLKDIAEEAVIMDPTRETPPEVRRLCVAIPEELKLLSIFTDVFDGFLRYLAQILDQQGRYPVDRFWRQVAACVARYRDQHPELATKLARHDLFAPTFARSCLNRLQLHDNRQMIDLADPARNLRFAGTLDNPIAGPG